MKKVIHNPADYTADNTAWNHPGSLAPVGSTIMIEVPPGTPFHSPVCDDPTVFEEPVIAQAIRTKHLQERDNAMQYQLLDGSKVYGRFRWTHG